MVVGIIIGIIFLIIVTISLLFLLGYNHFQEHIIRLNEAEASIDSVLRKRFDLLNKATDFIKEEVTEEENVLPTVISLRSQKLSNIELDKELYPAIEEFQSYAEKYEKLKENEGYVKTQINLMESESEIVALRKYYNDISKEYNQLITKFPSSMVAIIKKYHKKDLYEERKEKKSILEELKA